MQHDMQIRHALPGGADERRAFLMNWNALQNARHGVLVDALDNPALLAEHDGRLVGC